MTLLQIHTHTHTHTHTQTHKFNLPVTTPFLPYFPIKSSPWEDNSLTKKRRHFTELNPPYEMAFCNDKQHWLSHKRYLPWVKVAFFFFFNIYLFIYFGCAGSELRHAGSLVAHAGMQTLSCGMWTFSCSMHAGI